MPAFSIISRTRCGCPVAATPGSVITSTRCTPYVERSWPISSDAPLPNFSCGAPYVKTVSGLPVATMPGILGRGLRGVPVDRGGARQRVPGGAEQVAVERLGPGHPDREVGRPVLLDDVRLDTLGLRADPGVEDQVDAVVVLDQPVRPWTGEVRGVHVQGGARFHVQPGLFEDLATQRVPRVLAVVHAAARERPPARDPGARGHPGQQHLLLRSAAAPQDGVRRDPLASRRCTVEVGPGHGEESRTPGRRTDARADPSHPVRHAAETAGYVTGRRKGPKARPLLGAGPSAFLGPALLMPRPGYQA